MARISSHRTPFEKKKNLFLIKAKKVLKKIARFSKNTFKQMKPIHFIVLVLILGLGVFNGVTGALPQIKQQSREKNIVKTFNRWWRDTGAAEFKTVGIEPTKQVKYEEYQRYREKYLEQNPTYIIEDRVESMKKGYREWWENQGGREAFIQENGRYPDEKDYRNSLESWVNKFTDKFLRYSLAFVPKNEQYDRIFTSWILFPGVCSFLHFAVFFIFAISLLYKRWNLWILVGFTAAWTIASPLLVSFMASTSFFDHYEAERYMGMSLTVAFLLGAAGFASNKQYVKQRITGICVAGLAIDMIINWFINPGIFGTVAVLAPICFGVGALAGFKIETRLRSQEEVNAATLEERLRKNASSNLMAERKAKTRTLIEEGFASAKNCRPDLAQQQLGQALTQLLQEHPVDIPLVKSTAERMTAPDQFLEFSSTQWMEWGETAKAKNAPEAAICLLKKALTKEKDPIFARRTLFTLGNICINHKIELSEGIRLLNKVIEMNGSDMLAKQAEFLISKASESQGH